MYDSNAACCVSLRMSPVVLKNTTALYAASDAAVNTLLSSVAVTVNPFAAPRSRIAWMPAGIESCRKPAVLLNTSTWYGAAQAGRSVPADGQRSTGDQRGTTCESSHGQLLRESR